MKTFNLLMFIAILFFYSCKKEDSNDPQNPALYTDMIINHVQAKLSQFNKIPSTAIQKAKDSLHIVYGHTSHGSQITDGMTGLATWKGATYNWNAGGTGSALDLQDYYTNFGGYNTAQDLGNPDYRTWESATRQYLNTHTKTNVVIWSWCGQVGSQDSASLANNYLNLMNKLEADYPKVKFVYMTGHLDGSGLTGGTHLRNEQIRRYCNANKKILYDFNDIESYNPDGAYFGDKMVTDNCDYDKDGNGSAESNWATEWQSTHTKNVDWYDCTATHSQPLNGNQKTYAAWWLWARLAGWGN